VLLAHTPRCLKLLTTHHAHLPAILCTQARKDQVSMDAFWYATNTTVSNNTVFHSLLMSMGSRTSWRSYSAQQADILQTGEPDAKARAKALPLDNFATTWWMQGCTISGNKLMLPPGTSPSSTTSSIGRIDSTGSASGSPQQQQPGPDGSSSVASSNASLLAGPSGAAAAANEWLEAVPYASYSDALSAVLDANEGLLLELAQGGGRCHAALRQAVDAQQAQLTLQVMLRASAPAVLWASTTQGYLADTSISTNSGFFHTLRWVGVGGSGGDD
jgi:hypothetical protein